MKTIPITLLNHYKGDYLTLAQCFKLKLRNGTTMGFTSFDEDIVFTDDPDGTVYEALSGMSPTAISSSSQFNVDNLDVEGYIEPGRITEGDIKNGTYDYADVEIFEINWNDKPYLLTKRNLKRAGKLGEIKVQKGKFTAEIRGLMQYFQNNIGLLYQPTCRANFCDSKCASGREEIMDKELFSHVGTVVAVSLNRVITVGGFTQPTDYFKNGELLFLDGLNIATKGEIKSWNAETNELQLMLPANYAIAVGDTLKATKGCNKLKETCDDYLNAENFRGEPFIPTIPTMINQGIK